LRFRWRRVLHAVSLAEGPERIAMEWWRTCKTPHPRGIISASKTTMAAASGSTATASTNAKPRPALVHAWGVRMSAYAENAENKMGKDKNLDWPSRRIFRFCAGRRIHMSFFVSARGVAA
jgi:hypothetical protein